jgi:hypothetical protein
MTWICNVVSYLESVHRLPGLTLIVLLSLYVSFGGTNNLPDWLFLSRFKFVELIMQKRIEYITMAFAPTGRSMQQLRWDLCTEIGS